MSPRPNNVAPRDLPTTTLYLPELLREDGGRIDWESRRAGPFSFRFDDRLIVVRYATEDEIGLARSIKQAGGRVIYLIDDDLEAIVADPGLPGDYRSRIGEFLKGPWQDLGELIDEVVVSSPALAEKLRRRKFDPVTVLDPFWPIPAGEVVPSEDPLRIAWLCTRSHIADLESIADPLGDILASHRDISLTVFFGKARPPFLKKMRRVENLKPLPWPDYRHWLSGQRFDIALYPLLDTDVNRSRSINKFLEHAVAGAASILSANAPFMDRLQPGDCFSAEVGEWGDCLETLLADRAKISEIANRARGRAREMAEAARARQIAFWKSRLPALEIRNSPDNSRI